MGKDVELWGKAAKLKKTSRGVPGIMVEVFRQTPTGAEYMARAVVHLEWPLVTTVNYPDGAGTVQHHSGEGVDDAAEV